MTAYGIGGHVGISFQDSFGTANVDSFHYFPIVNESLTEAIPPLESETIQSRYDAPDAYEGAHEITGEIVFNGHNILLGVVLKGWCGQSSGSLVTSHYDHSLIPVGPGEDFDSLSPVPPMTIEVYRDAGSAHQYYDCVANEVTLEWSYGSFVRATVGVVGGKFSKVAKTTPSYYTGSEYTWDQTSVHLAGTAIDEYQELSLSLMNNIEGRGTLDNTKTWNRMVRNDYRRIELSGTMLFPNDDEFDNFRNGTLQRLVIHTKGVEVTSGYYGNFMVDMPSMRYSEFTPAIGGPGPVEASFTAEGKYNTGSSTAIEFTLTNTAEGF